MIAGLLGALFFCALGFAMRRKKLVVLLCILGVILSLAYAYTGYREFKNVQLYGHEYSEKFDASCKTFLIGSIGKIQPRDCKVISPRPQDQ
jgi:uncharacterized membrane protein